MCSVVTFGFCNSVKLYLHGWTCIKNIFFNVSNVKNWIVLVHASWYAWLLFLLLLFDLCSVCLKNLEVGDQVLSHFLGWCFACLKQPKWLHHLCVVIICWWDVYSFTWIKLSFRIYQYRRSKTADRRVSTTGNSDLSRQLVRISTLNQKPCFGMWLMRWFK